MKHRSSAAIAVNRVIQIVLFMLLCCSALTFPVSAQVL